MVKEYNFGQIVLFTKAIGRTVKRMVRADTLTKTAMCIKEAGKRVKLMDMEFICILMDPIMKVNGWKINKKEMA